MSGPTPIPTLFVRDPREYHKVTDEWQPDCTWVRDGLGAAYVMPDGVLVEIAADRLRVPLYCTGKRLEHISRAIDAGVGPQHLVPHDGLYWIVGPHFYANRHLLVEDQVLPVADDRLRFTICPRTYDGLLGTLRDYPALPNAVLRWMPFPGLVFVLNMGGIGTRSQIQRAKIRARDFGLPWPRKEGSPS